LRAIATFLLIISCVITAGVPNDTWAFDRFPGKTTGSELTGSTTDCIEVASDASSTTPTTAEKSVPPTPESKERTSPKPKTVPTTSSKKPIAADDAVLESPEKKPPAKKSQQAAAVEYRGKYYASSIKNAPSARLFCVFKSDAKADEKTFYFGCEAIKIPKKYSELPLRDFKGLRGTFGGIKNVDGVAEEVRLVECPEPIL